MQTLDLRAEADSSKALAAIAALRQSGGRLRLITATDPAVLLAGLDLYLRNSVVWESKAAEGCWETVFRPAADGEPGDLLARLVRDHRELDSLLGRALRRLNAGDTAGAGPMLASFAQGLRRHLRFEDEVLSPALGPDAIFAPLAEMHAEHRSLTSQLADLEAALGAEAWELETFAALLSGTLAKHEHREEAAVFPAWRVRLAALDPAARAALDREATRSLLHPPLSE